MQRRGNSLLIGFGIGAVALIVYALFAQGTVYKFDAEPIVLAVVYKQMISPRHVALVPLLGLVHPWVAGPTWGVYQTALALSALGVAVGVFFVHRGFTRMTSPGNAALAACAFALCPPIFFFATVVEYHGPFVAPLGLAFYAFALLLERRSILAAIGVGLACGLAFLMHSSGILLPGLFGVWYLSRCAHTEQPRRLAAVLAGLGASFAAMMLAVPGIAHVLGGRFEWSGFFGGAADAPGGVSTLAIVPKTIWQEWLVPFLPVSVTWLLAFRRRELRREAIALVVCLVPYLAMSHLLLRGDPEFGAYLLPLALPAVWLTLAATPRWSFVVIVLAGATLGVVAIRNHDKPEIGRAYADASRQITGGKPAALLVGSVDETFACFVALPECQPYPLYHAAHPDPVERGYLPSIREFVARQHEQGRQVFLTAVGRLFLDSPEAFGYDARRAALVRKTRRELYAVFALEEVGFKGYRCYRVVDK